MKRRARQMLVKLLWFVGVFDVHDAVIDQAFSTLRGSTPSPLMRAGRRHFSQVDEDGIIGEIVARVDAAGLRTPRRFVELGVGNGSENNTLALAALGWEGRWYGGEDLVFDPADAFGGRLVFDKCWVTLDYLERQVIPTLRAELEIGVLSLDLDGNDWYFCRSLLAAGIRPVVWVQEYNSTMPPTSEWKVAYDDALQWHGTSYFGASLGAFVRLFEAHGYRLVSCNVTGVNAFFVRNDFDGPFDDVPRDWLSLYMPPRPWLYKTSYSFDARVPAGFSDVS